MVRLLAWGRIAKFPNAHQAKIIESAREPRATYLCYNCNMNTESFFRPLSRPRLLVPEFGIFLAGGSYVFVLQL